MTPRSRNRARDNDKGVRVEPQPLPNNDVTPREIARQVEELILKQARNSDEKRLFQEKLRRLDP